MQESNSKINFPFDLNNVKKIEKIDEGGYCEIYLVESKETKNKYVAKVTKDELPKEDINFFIEQVNKIQNYQIPGILKIYGISLKDFDDDDHLTIITEYMPSGSLKNIFTMELKKKTSSNWNSTKKFISFLSIALSMKYLHDNRVVLGELNPSNIFLDSNFYPKINPIQISNFFESENDIKAEKYIYIAPEINDPSDYTDSSDVYSFAFIAYTFFTGKFPSLKKFKNLNEWKIKVQKNERPNMNSIEDEQIIDLLEKCWGKDPSRRYSFEYIVNQILRGKYQKVFKSIDKYEVTKYINKFIKSDDSLKIHIFPREFNFHFSEEDFGFKLNISGYQTVGDVIQIITDKNQYNFEFDLFYANEKLDVKSYFVDVAVDNGEVTELVRCGGNSEKPLQDEKVTEEAVEPPTKPVVKKPSNKSDSSDDTEKPLKGEKLTNEPVEPPPEKVTKKPSDKFDSSDDIENPPSDNHNQSSSSTSKSSKPSVLPKAPIKVPKKKIKSSNSSSGVIIKQPLSPLSNQTSSDSDQPPPTNPKPPKVSEKVDNKKIVEEPDQPLNVDKSCVIYKWDVSDKNMDQFNSMVFKFPIQFTINDAIDQIEDIFENKFNVKIVEKKGNKTYDVIDYNLNVYDRYFDKKTVKPIVIKNDIKYKFSTENGRHFKDKRFHFDEKLNQIARFLVFNESKQSLLFNDQPPEEFKLTDKLEFVYKNREYSGESTFSSLKYKQNEGESIMISLPIPTFSMYSPLKFKTLKCKSDSIPINNIKKIIKKDNDCNFILYNECEMIGDADSNKKDQIKIDTNTIIDFFTYKTKVGFNFDLNNEKLDDYFIYINDKNITIDEIKSMIVAYIAKCEDNERSIFSPKRIILTYKDKKIKNNCLFNKIEYEPGEFITVSIEKVKFHVKLGTKIKEFEIEDRNAIVADLQREISSSKQYKLKYKDEELKGTKRLKNIKTSENENFIIATPIKSRILTYKGVDYDLDIINLNKVNELKQYVKQVFNIDIESCEFIFGDSSIQLSQFKKLPEVSKVEAFDVKEKKKFNNFIKEKYCNIFNRDQTINDVRQYAISIMKNRYPCCIKTGDFFLPGQTNLFKIEGQIEIIKMKKSSYKKTFYMKQRFNSRIIGSKEFNVNDNVSELKKFVIEKLANKPFKLMTKNGTNIDEFEFIHEFADEVFIVEMKETKSGKVTFVINRNDQKPLEKVGDFYENKLNIKYKKELKMIDGIDYILFSQGKLITQNYENLNHLKDVDESMRKVQTYPISMLVNYDEDNKGNNDVFNFTAKAVQKDDREKVTIDEIVLYDIEKATSDDVTEGQISIAYDEIEGPKTILDLRLAVANELDIDDINKVVLFILFSGKDGSDFAMLFDDEEVNQVLIENPKKNINYKILEPKRVILPQKLIKKYQKYAKDHGMELNDQQIKDIYVKVDHDVNTFLATIDYQSCRISDE